MGSTLVTFMLAAAVASSVLSKIQASAFIVQVPRKGPLSSSAGVVGSRHAWSKPSTSIFMAGFGGSSPAKGKKGKKGSSSSTLPKLKPKTQWERFDKLKGATRFNVAVRIVTDGPDEKGEWLEVGKIKSENNEFTEIAVSRQRAMIAEHARRVHPLKVKPNDRVEWGYKNGDGDDEEWILVDKDVGTNAPTGIEKKIGFEGTPDPGSGYYCSYDQGMLVSKVDKTFKGDQTVQSS